VHVTHVQTPGVLMLTEQRLYFQPGELNNVGSSSTTPFNLNSIVQVRDKMKALLCWIDDVASWVWLDAPVCEWFMRMPEPRKSSS
jgi:hypothetical protein